MLLNYQTSHLLSLPTRYYFEKNKSGFDVYKSVNFFLSPPPRRTSNYTDNAMNGKKQVSNRS